MAYLLDSNTLIDAKNHYYRFEVCPGFWKWLSYAHEKGIVLSIKQVRDELMAREDKLSEWCKTRKKMFVVTEDSKTYDSMAILATWVAGNYKPAAQAKFLGAADFHLVAHAHAHGHIIVTKEITSFGNEVKIPNACQMMAVQCISTFEMLSREKVEFDWEEKQPN